MSTQSFGKYQLLRKLATGGMAEVWLARQTGIEGFNRLVVLKRILPHLSEDKEFVQMFLNEARIAAKFNHPNIAQIYELGEENGTYFIAMEYIHGEDLGRVMRKAWSSGQWISLPLAIRVIAASCEGLSYAHNRADESGRPLKVVHRDISPQNILVSFDGTVKLVDFGIAKAADLPSLTKSGAIKGKFAYMAPEQAAGKVLDHRSDIFAIGLVLYELLTGVRPLKRDSEIATLQAALECAIEAPSAVAEVTADLDSVVMRALSKAPDDRYRDASEFQMALEEYLVGQRQVASSVQIAELMRTLFADRLAEEAKSGEPEPPAEEARSRSGTADAPKSRAGGEWEAPSGKVERTASRVVSKGMAKGSYRTSAGTAAPVEPPKDVPGWEAPPGEAEPSVKRTRTSAGEMRRSSETAVARTPSRADVPRTSSRVMHTKVAPAEEDPDAPQPLGSEAAPRKSGGATAVPRTGSRTALKKPAAAAPAGDKHEAPAEPRPARPRRTSTGEVRTQPRAEERPRRPPSRAGVEALSDDVDLEEVKEKQRRRLSRVLWVSTLAAAALMAFIFRDSLLAFLVHTPTTGQEIYVSVETNIPVHIRVKHDASEHNSHPIEDLSSSDVSRATRLSGAHLRDTIVLDNPTLGAYEEHEVAYGSPGDLISIRKEFRTGFVLVQTKPKVDGLKLYAGEVELGNAGLKVELVEGKHTLKLHGDALKRDVPLDVTVVGGGFEKTPVVDLTPYLSPI